MHKIAFLFIFVIIQSSGIQRYEHEAKFLQNFVENSNTTFTINTCWNDSNLMIFLRGSMSLKRPKQIEIHKLSSPEYFSDFFHYFSTNNWYILDFINCEAKHLHPTLEFMNRKKLFRYPLKHLFLFDGHNNPNLVAKFARYEILPMSEIIIAIVEEYSVNMYQPYKIRNNGELFIEHYGNWTPEGGMSRFYKNIPTYSNRRKNFQKSEIIVDVVVKNPKSLEVKNFDDFSEADENEPYFFQDFPNVHSLLQFINASFSFRIFDSYGYLNHSTGKFDGMVQDLYKERGDISGNTLFLSEDRHTVVEFIKTFNSWGTKFLLKKPSTSYIENIYFITFATKVWIASLVVLLVFGIVLFILLNWEVKTKINKSSDEYSFSDITLISFEAVCQQGTFTDSKTYSGRILLFIMFAAFMFLYVAYSAYILVLLQSTKPITSVRKLVDSRIECGGLNISFMMAYYTATKDDALRELYRKKIYPDRFFTLEQGLRKVKDGNFAFQAILGPAYNFILKEFTNEDICKLQELPGYMNTGMYIAVPKTSQYKKFFKIGLMRVDESGLQIRTKNRVSMKPKCYNEAGNFQSVRLYDCHSVFILYLYGILLSIIILLMEKIVVKYKSNKIYSIQYRS